MPMEDVEVPGRPFVHTDDRSERVELRWQASIGPRSLRISGYKVEVRELSRDAFSSLSHACTSSTSPETMSVSLNTYICSPVSTS